MGNLPPQRLHIGPQSITDLLQSLADGFQRLHMLICPYSLL